MNAAVDTPGADVRPASAWLPWAAFAVALVARALWALTQGLSIEQEGAEYARIAQNLLAGKGYVGIFDNGVQLNFPPGYPIAIAALTLIVGNAEVAARLVNIVLGAAMVIPGFRLAEMAGGRRVAIVAAAMLALHPVLVAAGASTYSEGAYLAVMMFAMWLLVRWIVDDRLRDSIGAGLLFGVAYLIRPEAFLLALLFTAGGLLASAFVADGRRRAAASIAMLIAFAIVAAPNVAFLSYHTGKIRIEAKGTLAYQWGQKINNGMSYAEAVAGIGPDLSDQGVFMRPNLDVLKSTSYTASQYAAFAGTAARRNAAPIVRTLAGESAFGSPWLLLLAALGLAGAAWSRRRLQVDGPLLVSAAMFVLVLLAVQELWLRYFFAALGMSLLWAAHGAVVLGDRFEQLLRRWAPAGTVAATAGRVLTWAVVLLVLLLSARHVTRVEQFEESGKFSRTAAGRWLAQQQPSPRRVMSFELQVPYYAGANIMLLPYASSELALAYIAKHKPDYIVLVGGSPGGLPYTRQWFAEGVPSPSAQLVYDEFKPGGEHVKIFRWNPGPAAAGRP